MGSPLRSVLTNKVMAELDIKITKKLIEDERLKFHGCFAGHTLLVIKPKDTGRVH